MDLMLGEPLNAALARLPLSQRITSAILDHSGPYMPYLDVAAALESPNTQATRALCDLHQMNSEEVNRALLRTLSQIRPRPARGLLLA
jgi:c-di-GMP-related signal transduction protein